MPYRIIILPPRISQLVSLVGLLALSSHVWATPPDLSSSHTSRYEVNVLPALSADSDRGFGFGLIGALAQHRQDIHPFVWRMQAVSFLTVKEADGGVETTSQKYRLKIDLPGLYGGRLRLNLALRYEREIGAYYGLGNASAARGSGHYHEYRRNYPRARVQLRMRGTGHLWVLVGASFEHNQIEQFADSKLTEDLRSQPQIELLRGASDHVLAVGNVGLIWDSRNDESAPSDGMFHEVSLRYAPNVSDADIAYGGFNFTLRLYRAVYGEAVVLATRLMADLLVGHPPFYELVRHGGLHPDCSVGGGSAVRGVPRHRYHGKVKLLGNVELRFKLLPFTLLGQRSVLGAIAFVDGGRVWADYAANPQLDGHGLGLKFGVGGGLRVQWGKTFVIRGDVAWSPDADPVGLYLNVNHIF